MSEILDTTVTTDDIQSPVVEATRIIDGALAWIIGRELISATEVTDVLLDTRNALIESVATLEPAV